MLAGCSSSSLLSPRHRLRSDYSSMSTQRLDLPCTFPQNPTSRHPFVRPVSLSVEAPIEARRLSLKRFAEQSSFEEDLSTNRVKRMKGNLKSDEEDSFIGSLSQLGTDNFWFQDPGSSPFLLKRLGRFLFKSDFLEEIARVEEFVRDPLLIRVREASTVQVAVPRVVAPPVVPAVAVVAGDGCEADELLSAQTKRAAMQRKAAAVGFGDLGFAENGIDC